MVLWWLGTAAAKQWSKLGSHLKQLNLTFPSVSFRSGIRNDPAFFGPSSPRTSPSTWRSGPGIERRRQEIIGQTSAHRCQWSAEWDDAEVIRPGQDRGAKAASTFV